MIPKIIHFIWLDTPLPDWAERNVAEFRRLNPDYEIVMHGADDICDEYRPLCTPDEHPSTRSDLIRYGFLEQVGGWYFDVDYWPVRPVADIEHAYGLDGSKLFCAWMDNPRINNGVLACGPGLQLWRRMAEWIHAGGVTGTYGGRTKYGPRLITRLHEQTPSEVCAAPWPWLHGVKPDLAPKVYRHVIAHGGDSSILTRIVPECGGQLPFAFHLWAHTHGDRFAGEAGRPISAIGSGSRLVAICGRRPKHEDGERPWQNIAEACARLGFRAEIVDYHDPDAFAKCSDLPEAVFCWNGLKGVHKAHAEAARNLGAKVIVLEHGFYDRNEHFQADHEGILHRASWRRRLRDPAPDGALERLRLFYPNGLAPIRLKKQGYVLVLGQVNGDSQLLDCEIRGTLPLQRLAKTALPHVTMYFRPHPLCANVRKAGNRQILPVLSDGPEETQVYHREKRGSGLATALDGARCVIAINSNALNDALAAGVPCLAFGPFLGIDAGVVHPATVATFKADLAEMLDGWHPQTEQVENYLAWLAARQWSVAEFGAPDLVGRLLADAGVILPQLTRVQEAAG